MGQQSLKSCLFGIRDDISPWARDCQVKSMEIEAFGIEENVSFRLLVNFTIFPSMLLSKKVLKL